MSDVLIIEAFFSNKCYYLKKNLNTKKIQSYFWCSMGAIKRKRRHVIEWAQPNFSKKENTAIKLYFLTDCCCFLDRHSRQHHYT